MKSYFANITSACVLIMLIVMILANKSYAQISESEAKATWIHTLIPYIKWQTRSDKKITICTIGQEGVFPSLEKIIKEEKLDNSNVEPIYVKRSPDNSDFKECHMLYVSISEAGNVVGILDKTNAKGILTISSTKDFADKGGVVEFVVKGEGLKLRINTKAAQNQNIIIDSDLLGFAETVSK